MKKAFLYSMAVLAMAALPALAQAQTASLFNFKASNKATVTPVVVQPQAPESTASAGATTTTDTTIAADDDLTLLDLQNQPLPIRRKMVSARLADIVLKLNLLSDKTKAAADRLGQNGIATDSAQTNLAHAALTLAQAKLTIDALALAANDPKNENELTLIVDGATFKDGVLKTEDMLRTARQSIIDSLAALKIAVTTSATVTSE